MMSCAKKTNMCSPPVLSHSKKHGNVDQNFSRLISIWAIALTISIAKTT